MIPKFSIKHMLYGMVVLGVLSLLIASATRGNKIAFGLSVAAVGSFIPFLAYAALHWASFSIALIPIPGIKQKAAQENATPLSTSEIESEIAKEQLIGSENNSDHSSDKAESDENQTNGATDEETDG